jgi:hypothetical protein
MFQYMKFRLKYVEQLLFNVGVPECWSAGPIRHCNLQPATSFKVDSVSPRFHYEFSVRTEITVSLLASQAALSSLTLKCTPNRVTTSCPSSVAYS